jgi:hypothetical protein
MGSARLLLATAALSTMAAAALLTALASFGSRSLPQAVGGDLASSPHTAIAISGQFGASQARTDDSAVRAGIRRSLAGVGSRLAAALWSDPFGVSAQGSSVTLVQAAAISQVRRHATLASGSWPQAGPARVASAPIQVAVPQGVAAALHLTLGQRLELRDRLTGARVTFEVAGLYRVTDPAAPFWGIDLIAPTGVSVLPGFTTYGPLVVAQRAFGSGGLAVGGASWLDTPDVRHVDPGALTALAARVSQAAAYLRGSAQLGGLEVSTGLPAALSGAATRLVVARSLLAVSELELVLLALAAVALAARTLASYREDELAMLAARGSGRWQLAGLALGEALVINLVAAAAGALLGSRLAAALAQAGTLRGAGLRLAGIPGAVWWTAGLVTALATLTMIWPALRPMTPGAVRVRRGRRAAVAGTIRAGGDLALVLLAVLSGWQLRQYSVIGSAAGRLGLDPVLAIAPAMALAAVTIVPLRMLPLIARGADRLAARTRKLPVAMTSWQVSRRAVRQSAPMLLVVLAVGTGTLALAQHQSWLRSTSDQSAFIVGADVRASVLAPEPLSRSAAISSTPGVSAAMAVATSLGAPSGGQVLAVDASHAAATVLLRSDQVALRPADLWQRIIPARQSSAIRLPGRPARLELTARLSTSGSPVIGQAAVSVSVQDASGAVYAIPAGTLRGDGKPHSLIAVLSAARQAAYPLRVLAVTIRYPVPREPASAHAATPASTFSIEDASVSAGPGGPFGTPFATAPVLTTWTTLFRASAGQGGQAGLPSATPSGQVTIAAQVPFTAIPGIATTAFLHSGHLAVGDVVHLSAPDASVPVRIVAVAAHLPTVTSPQGGLVVDLSAAQEMVAAQSAQSLPVTQWWLATAGGKTPAGLPGGLALASRAGQLTALRSDPLSLIPQQAVLAVAVAAALLAILGFSVSVAAGLRERRSQSALLSALGVRAATQTRTACLEALVVSIPAAGTGLLLGAALAWLLVPAVTVTATATAPVPPVLVEVPLAQALTLALAVAIIPVLAAIASGAYRPDPAAQLRAAEAT